MKRKTIWTTMIASATLSASLLGTSAPAMAENLRCDSPIGGYNYCRVRTSGGVELRVQHTPHPCYRNDTWGYDAGGIWVANGCSATFHIGGDDKTAAAVGLGILALGVIGALADDNNNNNDNYNQPPPPPPQGYPQGGYPQDGYPQQGGYPQGGGYPPSYPGDDYDGQNIVSCDSKNNKSRFCPVPIQSYAELVHQRSRSACRFNKTWGYDRRGIWVKKGCRGDFAIY